MKKIFPLLAISAMVLSMFSLSGCALIYDKQVDSSLRDCDKLLSSLDRLACRDHVRKSANESPIGIKAAPRDK